MHMRTLTAAFLSVGALASAANAEIVFGLPITMTENGTTATAYFSTGKALWTGMLYRDDGTAGLGQFMFNNKSARAGDTRVLGTFDAGDQITFNYKVVTGLPAVYRGDNPLHAFHLGLELFDTTTVAVRIEDMPAAMSDRDWDDCVAIVRFSKPVVIGDDDDTEPTPTPGVLGVAMISGALAGRRRR
jgi:MYXO-CTERM domain-containing protein